MSDKTWPIAYGVKHKKEDVRMGSQSGGAFAALSDLFLSHGGIIYGCRMVNAMKACHDRADSSEKCKEFRGSKYIQSNMGDCFRLAKADLRQGRKVLFSGTPCQIAGLKEILSQDEKRNLLTADLVCHGVSSPKVWKDFVLWKEKKLGGSAERVNFRNKKEFGWASHVETITVNGKENASKLFAHWYSQFKIIRPACYHCPYRNIHHPADITIGDFWGIDKVIPDFNDNKGVSLVLINNERGMDVFELLKSVLEYKEVDVRQCMQPPLEETIPEPEGRADFWKEYRKRPFWFMALRYDGIGIKKKLKKLFR